MNISSLREKVSHHKRKELHDSSLTHSAVLVLFTGSEDSPEILLTRRTNKVEHHKGQISFAGGVVDDVDSHIIATALRETEEEIGLPSSEIEILGLFDDMFTYTGFIITPVIGYCRNLPILQPNQDEVAEVIKLPFDFFFDPKNRTMKLWERNGKEYEVYFYNYENYEVWGATAYIIKSFVEFVLR